MTTEVELDRRNLSSILWAMNKGHRAVMICAGSFGAMAEYKRALAITYGLKRVAKRVFQTTVDQAYDFAMQEVEKLMEYDDPKHNRQLEFWGEVVKDYDDRHIPMP